MIWGILPYFGEIFIQKSEERALPLNRIELFRLDRQAAAQRVPAANSFHDFQASVSDAWDIDEPITPTSAAGGASVHHQEANHVAPKRSQVGNKPTKVCVCVLRVERVLRVLTLLEKSKMTTRRVRVRKF